VLRRIFGPKRDEMVDCWRNFHNEELHNYNYNEQVKEDETGKARGKRGMYIGF
jgi:hypothetical protein